ncbi:MAG: S-layer homology domain-containing protein [Caryophanon sp.]|nr:S-layer homology domain-containing protein [Caryophanon sp.]
MRKAFLATAVSSVAVTSCAVATEASIYADIPANYTYYETLQWAKDRGVVQGFPDGTFQPNAFITEAQFVMMLTRLIDATALQETTEDPHDFAYNYLESLGVTFMSATQNDTALRDREFTRLDVAKAFYTAVEGEAPSDKEAIDWMYAHGLSKGKGISEDKYIDFGGYDSLKRVHAAQFFRSFYTKVFAPRMYIEKTAYTKLEIEQLQQQPIAPVYADLNGDKVDELVMYHAINAYDGVPLEAYKTIKTDHYFAVYAFDEATNAYHFKAGSTHFNVQPTMLQRLPQQGFEDVLITFTDAQGQKTYNVIEGVEPATDSE